MLDPLPVSAVPEELAAKATFIIFIEPMVGPRRNSILNFFFGDINQFAPASHAARIERGIGFWKPKFGENQAKLLVHGKSWRNPNGANVTVGDKAAIKQRAVGGDDGRLETFRFGHQIRVGDVLRPERLKTRGAKPSGKPPKARITVKSTF